MKIYTLQLLIEKYLDKLWDWVQFGLSQNSSIIPEFVEKHIHKPWCRRAYGLS